jgi:hypothetical protein
LNVDSVVRQVSREVEGFTGIELVENGGNGYGHDKCKGNGHGGANGGDGHDEGECDEDAGEGETRGPVAEAICVAGEENAESAWQRYSCTVVAYNEDYLTGTIEANESYPEAVVTEATRSIEAVQVAGTEFVAGVENSVPIIGGPVGPGPVVDELGVISNTTTDYLAAVAPAITAGQTEQVAATTQTYVASFTDRYVPVIGGPIGPGPVVDELGLAADYTIVFSGALVDSTTRALSGSVTDGALATYSTNTLLAGQAYVSVLGDSAERTVPITGGPIGPGPVVTEVRESADGIMTSTITLSDALTRTVPIIGGPVGPGPTVKEYLAQLP